MINMIPSAVSTTSACQSAFAYCLSYCTWGQRRCLAQWWHIRCALITIFEKLGSFIHFFVAWTPPSPVVTYLIGGSARVIKYFLDVYEWHSSPVCCANWVGRALLPPRILASPGHLGVSFSSPPLITGEGNIKRSHCFCYSFFVLPGVSAALSHCQQLYL